MARTIAKDHDKKRAHILKGAAKVFATEGFDRASMRQLAQECDVSKATIYHYYDSKGALLFDILDSYLLELRDSICGLDLNGKAPAKQLHSVVSEILRAYQGMDHEHQIQTGSLSALPPKQQNILRGYQRDLVRFVSKVIAAQAPAVFKGQNRKLHATTMSVFGMLNWYYMWNKQANESDREEYSALVSTLVLNGVSGVERLHQDQTE